MVDGRDLASLAELRGDLDPQQPPSPIFTHSQNHYPPGFEATSIDEDPRFRRFDPSLVGPSGADDFRLRWDSRARQHGAVLPDDLRTLDNGPPNETPDIGCFRLGAPPLSVGVDSRRGFPKTPFWV
jgi:hypothetical protein